MKSKRLISLISVLMLALLCGAGCSKKARLARLGRHADEDFAAEKYEAAELEYRQFLRSGMDAHALGRLGLVFAREGRVVAAYQCLKKSDQLDPKNPEVKIALGEAFLSLGSPSEAYQNARAVLSLQPTNGEAMLLLSESANTVQELDVSKSFLRALPGQPDRLPDFHVALATLAFKAQDMATVESELKAALQQDPKSAEAHYRMSQVYFKAHNGPTATNELRLAADGAPWRSPIRLNAAEEELRSSGEEASRKSLNEIIAHAPDFIPARLALMRLDFSSQHYDDCKKDIALILDEDSENYDASLELGVVNLAKSDYDGALKAFSNLEARRPYAAPVKYYLGLVYYNKNQQDDARRYLNQAIQLSTNYAEPVMLLSEIDIRSKNFGDAVQRLDRLIQQQPHLLEPRLLLAEAYTSHQEPARAMAIYRQLVELEPKNPRMTYLLGTAQLQRNDLDGARNSFAKTLELDPDFIPALSRLVDVDIALKQYGEAEQYIQGQMKRHPDSGQPWAMQGQIDVAQNQSQQAVDALNKAISLDPGLSEAYVQLAQLYVATHQEQQALDKLNAVISRTNDLSALMALGVIQEQLKNYQAAADAYLKLLAVKPDFLPALNNVACLFADKLDQLDKAYIYAQKTYEVAPVNPHCADTLGWVLYKRGEFRNAIPLLKQGTTGDPGDAEIQGHLGLAYYMAGEGDLARPALQAAVNSGGSFAAKEDEAQCLAVLSLPDNSSDPKSVQVLEQAVKRDSRDPIATARLAEIDERTGAYDKAASLYEDNLKSNSHNVASMGRLAAIYADHLQRPDDALKLAQQAHDIDGTDSLATETLGRLSLDQGKVDYALSLLQTVSSRDDAPPRTLSDLARAQYASGREALAIASAQAAMAKQGAADQRDQLFLTLVSAADSPAAAKAALPQARAVLQETPNDLAALMVSAQAALADNDAKTAEGFYQTALSTFPNFPPALRQIALLYASQSGNEDNAINFAEKAHPYYEKDPQLAKLLGRNAYLHADYSRSVDILQQVPRQLVDGEILYYLGMDFYKLQRKADSKNALEKALGMNISGGLEADAKRALAELK